jgi:hypothetical protein
LLLHPHVLGEIIIGGMVAFVNLHAARAVVAGVEYALEKPELQRPSGLRLRTAIASNESLATSRAWRRSEGRVQLVADKEGCRCVLLAGVLPGSGQRRGNATGGHGCGGAAVSGGGARSPGPSRGRFAGPPEIAI